MYDHKLYITPQDINSLGVTKTFSSDLKMSG